jgi:fatty acid desaturase
LSTAAVNHARSEDRELAERVRNAGLLRRTPWYYSTKITLTLTAFAAGWVALFILGNSWAALGIAAFLAVMFTQVVFVGHDAGHQQIFRSRRANSVVGLALGNLLTGMSFGWWVPKHNAHHAHPNQPGRDPDIAAGVVAFTPEIARSRHGAGRLLARWQAWTFFPLLLLEAIALHRFSLLAMVHRRDRSGRIELALLVVHAFAYLAVVFWVLSPIRAVAFVAVQQGLFGLYLGCTFAPNHKGMPILDGDSEVSFARRQIVTARNITGGRFTMLVFGGLNYQIEHHLFPTMPRRNLARAQTFVRAFCDDHDLVYQEDTAIGSYCQALRYLAAAGTGNDPVLPPGGCPVAATPVAAV